MIKDQIASSDIFILLWTTEAARSPYVLYEAGMADAYAKPILIVTEPGSPELPSALSKYQIVTLKL